MSSPPIIPDHSLLRPIGRGAYGEVWLARNIMGAPRAVKIIWRHRFDSDRPYEREFAGIQRYEPVSRMTEGLVQVLHIGRNQAEGYFYYVMELGDMGNDELRMSNAELTNKPAAVLHSSLDTRHLQVYAPRTLRSDLKRMGRLPVADCLQIGLDVVSGLARLHQQGLVHRDVKPGNIIFVNGRAKLADIGLVSIGGEGRTFVGTEGYIPPEGPGTPAADIYALGMVLYEAVTGYSPDDFPKAPAEWFTEEATALDIEPSSARASEPLEFHEIVLKACEGAKERRYESAEQMQADLVLLQSGQSVRRTRALERRLARFRVLGIAAVVMLLLATAAVLLANYRARIEARNRGRELALRERAEAAERQSRQQLYTALLGEAHAVVQSGELGQRVKALDAIRRAGAISNSTDLRRAAVAALARPDLRFQREFPAGPGITLVAFDPSFQRVALARGAGDVEIWSVTKQDVITTLSSSANHPTHGAEWSRDGRFLAVKRDYSREGSRADVEIWDVPAARRIFLWRNVPQGAVCFHPNCQEVMRADGNDAVVYDLQTLKEVRRFLLTVETATAGGQRSTAAARKRVLHLVYAPDGQRVSAVLNAGNGSEVNVYDSLHGKLRVSQTFEQYVGAGIGWHSGGRWLSVPESSGAVYLVDTESGQSRVLGQHKAEAATTLFSPDGGYLFTGGWDRELICWDLRTMQRSFTIALDSFKMQLAAEPHWTAEGGPAPAPGRGSSAIPCAVISEPSIVHLYSFELPLQRELNEDLGPQLRHAAFSPDGRWVAASAQKALAVCYLDGCEPGGSLPAALDQEAAATAMFFSADSGELFAGRSRACFRWRVAPPTNTAAPPVLERLPIYQPPGLSFLCLISNSVVFTSSKGSQVLAPDEIEAGAERWAPTSSGIGGVSPDGRWLAIYRPYGMTLYVYALPGLQEVAKLPYPASIGTFRFSPASDEVVICSSRAGAAFWSTTTWEPTRVLTNFNRILFSSSAPSARTPTAWLNKDMRHATLYEMNPDPSELLPLPTDMLPLALSPDGRYLAMSVDRRRLQLWDMTVLRKELRELGIDWAD